MEKRIETEPAHSEYSPSSAKRWISCPASIRLSKKVKDVTPPSPQAIRGTACHEVGEKCLLEGCMPVVFQGKKMSNGYTITEEDVEAVEHYVDYCIQLNQEFAKVEQRIDLTFLQAGFFGTGDFSTIEGDTLIIVDYKNGYHAVEADDNPQMKCYAIGTLRALPPKQIKKIKTIRTVIVQPNAVHTAGVIREAEISKDDLLRWVHIELKPAIALTKIDEPFACAGEHCKFCPALAICDTFKEHAHKVSCLQFDSVQETKALEDYTAEEISNLLTVADLMADRASKIKEYAIQRAKSGEEIPNYKFSEVAGRRQWVDTSLALSKLVDYLPLDDIQAVSLKPIGKVEKALKDIGFSKPDVDSLLSELTQRGNGYVKLTKIKDKSLPEGSTDLGLLDVEN